LVLGILQEALLFVAKEERGKTEEGERGREFGPSKKSIKREEGHGILKRSWGIFFLKKLTLRK
jgi:hypothetical protein